MNATLHLSHIRILSLVFILSTPALAEPGPQVPPALEARPALSLDVEVDPLAYALDGHSLHVGIGWKRLRLDLGVFAMHVPGWADGSADFSTAFNGYGAKLQYFLFDEQSGGFVGVDMGSAHQLIRRDGTDLATEQRQVSVGANMGWRFNLVRGLYVTPWVGLSYGFQAREQSLGGQTYKPNPWTLFPTVHLGYRFR